MPLKGYGVLRGKAIERRREGSSDTPHFQIRVVDGDGVDFRIAVNVKSQSAPSDLLYLLEDDFRHPITAGLEAFAPGWHDLPTAPGDVNLDYVRGNLFDPALMRALPPDAAGPDNDLADVLDAHITRAIGDPSADLYAFGQRWGPEDGIPDKVFGFEPGDGVHDIHMNQGNDPTLRPRRRRLAGRRAPGALPGGVTLDRDLPRVPEPGVAHRRRDRPRDRGPAAAHPRRPARRPRCASSPRW